MLSLSPADVPVAPPSTQGAMELLGNVYKALVNTNRKSPFDQ